MKDEIRELLGQRLEEELIKLEYGLKYLGEAKAGVIKFSDDIADSNRIIAALQDALK